MLDVLWITEIFCSDTVNDFLFGGVLPVQVFILDGLNTVSENTQPPAYLSFSHFPLTNSQLSSLFQQKF